MLELFYQEQVAKLRETEGYQVTLTRLRLLAVKVSLKEVTGKVRVRHLDVLKTK